MTDYLITVSNHIEQAKLALAEPAGESPPFVVKIGPWFLEALERDATKTNELPWEARRMNKENARITVSILANDMGFMCSVCGWREETARWIEFHTGWLRMMRNSTVGAHSQLDPTPRHHPPE